MLSKEEASNMSSTELKKYLANSGMTVGSDGWKRVSKWIPFAEAVEAEERETRIDERERELAAIAKQANELVHETNQIMRHQRNVALIALIISCVSIAITITLAVVNGI